MDQLENIQFFGRQVAQGRDQRRSHHKARAKIRKFGSERVEFISITSRTLIFEYKTIKNTLQNITVTSQVNISGSISEKPGIHYINIAADSGGVYISG